MYHRRKMKELVSTLNLGPMSNKMDVPMAVETNTDLSVKKMVTIGKRRMTTEVEWLDYIALNNTLECGRKNVAMLLLNNNCRVNLPSALVVPSNTPMHNAILIGDIDLVYCLLNKGASIDAVNCEGDTPLHLAFMKRQDNLVELILSFIEKISNYVNPKNSQGLTHLHIACARKNASLVKNYLKAGANIQDSISADSSQWAGYTALHFAIEFGSVKSARLIQKAMKEVKIDGNCKAEVQLAYEKVKNVSIMVHILSAENHFLNFGYFTYPSYFHFACMRNNPKVVEDFIKNGADVNTPISRDAIFCGLYSPLHFAVESNCMENVKLLLQHGAIIENQNNEVMTPLHLAMYNENCTKQKYTIVDQLYYALGNKEKNIVDYYGLSYLHIACTRNDVELVKKLLNNGYNVNNYIQRNPRKFSNYTPLHFAVRYHCYQVVQLLIEHGADVNFIDCDESGSPLHLACQVGHADIIDLLLKNGAIAKLVRAKGNKTTLHLLVESYMDRENGLSHENRMELLSFIKKLVKLGVNVNAKDQFEYTALHMACWKLIDGSQCVKKLLEVGADVNYENVDGQTPLEMTYFESYCGNAEDYMTLYHHVQKLKALRYKINPKNESYCNVILREKDIWDPEHKEFKSKKIAKKDEQRRDEIYRLRNVRLYNPKLTLFDLLVCNTNDLVFFARDSVLKKIIEEKSLKKEYPTFSHFLRLKYNKAVKRLQACDFKNTKIFGKSRQYKKPRLR